MSVCMMSWSVAAVNSYMYTEMYKSAAPEMMR